MTLCPGSGVAAEAPALLCVKAVGLHSEYVISDPVLKHGTFTDIFRVWKNAVLLNQLFYYDFIRFCDVSHPDTWSESHKNKDSDIRKNTFFPPSKVKLHGFL